MFVHPTDTASNTSFSDGSSVALVKPIEAREVREQFFVRRKILLPLVTTIYYRGTRRRILGWLGMVNIGTKTISMLI